MVAAAVVAGVAATAGAVTSADASRRAGHTAGDAAMNAAQVQQNMYNQTREDLTPFRTAGQQALNPLLGLSGIGGAGNMMDTLNNMPGYQFTLAQGMKGVQNSAAARGLGSSGAALKGGASFATGLAQSNYNNYFNQLMGVAGMGQNSAALTGQIGATTAANQGNALIGAGQAYGAGIMGQGNAYSGLFNSIGSMGMGQMMGMFGKGG